MGMDGVEVIRVLQARSSSRTNMGRTFELGLDTGSPRLKR